VGVGVGVGVGVNVGVGVGEGVGVGHRGGQESGLTRKLAKEFGVFATCGTRAVANRP
jgi:hypothetical protein